MKIIKSFRKTITLKVDNDGEIIVKAPYFTSEKKILEFVEKHVSWIEKRKLDILWSKKSFKEGEIFFYLGQEYPLQFDDKSKKLNFD
jgi:predicted metal-dependent hydrolase